MPKNSLTTKSPFFVRRVEQEDRLGLAKSAEVGNKIGNGKKTTGVRSASAPFREITAQLEEGRSTCPVDADSDSLVFTDPGGANTVSCIRPFRYGSYQLWCSYRDYSVST